MRDIDYFFRLKIVFNFIFSIITNQESISR